MMPQERLWNPNYCRVMAANFALFFAFYLLTPLLPLYLVERFDATKDVVGLVLSGYTLTALIARPFSGFLVDTFPRKRVLMVCFFLFFIFFGGYLGASSLLLFTIVRTLHGAPFGALTVANSTVAIDVLPSSRRNEGIGYYGLSNNLAMAIAPTAAIYLYRLTDNFQLLFWLALVIAGLGMLCVSPLPASPKGEERGVKNEESRFARSEESRFARSEESRFARSEESKSPESAALGVKNEESRFARSEESKSPSSQESKSHSSLFTLHSSLQKPLLRWDRFFLLRAWLLAANMAFFGFCFGVISNYLAIYSKEEMGITGGTGTWFLLVSLGLVASRLQGARALREGKLIQNAAEGTLLSTVAYTLFVLFPNEIGYYGSAILLGLGNGHLWPAFQNMIISMAHHNERGTANSTLLISWDVGIGVGVVAGGFIAEHVSYAAAFWCVAVAQIVGTLLFFLFTRTFYNKYKLTD